MESSGRYQLSASLTEVYIPGASSLPGLALLLSFHGQALRLTVLPTQYPPEAPVTMKTRGVKAEDIMRFELVAEGVTIGGVSNTVGEVMGEELVGEAQHWLKFAPTFEPEIREETTEDPAVAPTLQSLYESSTADASPTKRIVRLLVLVTVARVPKRIRSPNRKPSSKLAAIPLVGGSCPYLERLAIGDQTALAVLETVKQARVDIAAKLTESQDREVGEMGTRLYLPVDSSAGGAIDLEIPNILSMSIDQLSVKDFDKLKIALSVLAAKAKSVSVLRTEVDQLRTQTASNLQARTDLQETVKETAEQLQAEAAALNALMRTAKEERAEAVDAWKAQQRRTEELEAENDALKGKLLKQGQELSQAKSVETRFSDAALTIDSLKRTLAESEKRRQELCEELEKAQRLNSSHSDSFKAAGMEWLRQRDQLKSQIRDLEAQLSTNTQELAKARAETAAIPGQIALNRELQSKIEQLEVANKGQTERNRGLQAALQEFESQSREFSQEATATEARLLADKKRLNEALTLVEAQLEAQQGVSAALTRQVSDQKRNIATLEQLCCIKEDLHQLYEDISQQNAQSMQTKDLLTRELDYLAERTLLQSQTVMEEARLIERYAEFCDEKEREAEQLKAQVVHYRDRNPVYTPIKEDPVDLALAEFLNAKEQTLLVNFLREDSSIYLFGTKRIFMKLENGKIASNY